MTRRSRKGSGSGRRTGRDVAPSRVFVIVARDQRALFDYLRWGFAAVPEVEVVLDRRLGSRRGAEAAPARDGQPDRRVSDRRRSRSERAELLARGFVISRHRVIVD